MKNVLPVALKYGNEVFDDNWIFQQDGANPHQHHLTQEWCRDNFPPFIDNNRCPENRRTLNPLDYSNRDELINVID